MDVLALRAQNPSAPVCTVNPTVLTLSQSSQKSPLVDCMNESSPQSESSSFPYASFTAFAPLHSHQTPYLIH
jgi:hypothetical protein